MHGPLGEVTENAPEAVVAFIGNQRVEHGVPYRVSCRVVGVSEAWFHKWRRRPDEPTKREVRRLRWRGGSSISSGSPAVPTAC